jgi:hypothetical protein
MFMAISNVSDEGTTLVRRRENRVRKVSITGEKNEGNEGVDEKNMGNFC